MNRGTAVRTLPLEYLTAKSTEPAADRIGQLTIRNDDRLPRGLDLAMAGTVGIGTEAGRGRE